MKPSEVIREARNVLFERGWHQGAFSAEAGSICSAEALRIANPNFQTWCFDPASIALASALHLSDPDQICVWNDEVARTFAEVVDAFDRAEKIAEQAEALNG